MWQYIITWILVLTTPIICPDASREDEFGRKGSYHTCLILHTKIDSINKEKIFYDRDSMANFYSRIKIEEINCLSNFIFPAPDCITRVKLDSIYRE